MRTRTASSTFCARASDRYAAIRAVVRCAVPPPRQGSRSRAQGPRGLSSRSKSDPSTPPLGASCPTSRSPHSARSRPATTAQGTHDEARDYLDEMAIEIRRGGKARNTSKSGGACVPSSVPIFAAARRWQQPPICVSAGRGLFSAGGRYWVRTSDLFGVNEARYHCANRPLLCAAQVSPSRPARHNEGRPTRGPGCVTCPAGRAGTRGTTAPGPTPRPTSPASPPARRR